MKRVVLIDRMTGVIPNKYEAVRVVAKEARRINALLVHGAQGEVDEKPTMMALSRLLENRIKYKFGEGLDHSEPFEEDEA
jgi:DNA-directed RNA polymerase subunit K/omega